MKSYLTALWIHISATLIVAIGFSSCQKEGLSNHLKKTWGEYGDYYSFDEGLLFDNSEYHERYLYYSYGSMHRIFGLKVESSVLTIHYHSYSLSSMPWNGKEVDLSFRLSVDSLLYEPGKKWEMKTESDNDSCGSVSFGGAYQDKMIYSGYEDWEISGWISFTLGEERNFDASPPFYGRYYWVPDLRFEFELRGPDGEIVSVEEGYIRMIDRDCSDI